MAINTHGIKMTGLKALSGKTKDLQGYYSGSYVEVCYDRSTGKAWGVYHYSLGQNTWTQYHDPAVIKCGNVSEPMTMQALADLIASHVDREVA